MENSTTFILYCIISYLFEIGCSMIPHGTNWFNFIFAQFLCLLKLVEDYV